MASRRTLRDEDLRLNIILDGKQVPRENKKLLSELGKLERAGMDMERQYARLAKQQKELTAAQKKAATPERAMQLEAVTAQMNLLSNAMKANALQQKEMRQQVGLTGMTMNQLRTHLHLLQIEQSNVGRYTNPDVWKKLQKEIGATSYEIKKQTTNSSWLGMVWDDVSKKANKYGAAIAAIGMIVYQVTDFIGQFTRDLRELEDNMAGVRRTTDLTREQVIELKKAFDTMDTRTTTKELLEMAKVGGRLGETDILGFVDSMNKLNIALGEDLMQDGGGTIEDVAKSLGKLVQNFQVTDELPLNEALLRTGSVLNELDKSSTASAGRIVEYLSRLSGIAPTVGMSLPQVAGLAAYLDSAGVNAEMATTAIQRFWIGMGKTSNIEKYSKILGVTTDQYKDMTKKDFNSVFLKLIQTTLSSAEGVTELSAELGKLGVNQALAQQTLSKVGQGLQEDAGGMSKLVKQQEIAIDVFKSSDSIMKEYAITNENFTAQLEKQEKRVVALRNSIGMELEPSVLGLKKAYVDFLYVLRDVGKWIINHWRMITAAGIAFAAYKVNVLLASRGITTFTAVLKGLFPVMAKIFSSLSLFMTQINAIPTSTNKAKFALKKMFDILSKNLVLVAIASIAALAAAFVLLTRKTHDAAAATKEFKNDINEIKNAATEYGNEEKARLAGLFDTLRKNWNNTNERKKLIAELNKTYPEYIKNLSAEKTQLVDLLTIQNDANKALEYNIVLKKGQETKDKIILSRLNAEEKEINLFSESVKKAYGNTAQGSQLAAENVNKLLDLANKLSGLNAEDLKNYLNPTDLGFRSAEAGVALREQSLKKLKEQAYLAGISLEKDVFKPLSAIDKTTKQSEGNAISFLVSINSLRQTEINELNNMSVYYDKIQKDLEAQLGVVTKINKQKADGGDGGDGSVNTEADDAKKTRIENEKQLAELWMKQQQVNLMIEQREKQRSEDWFNDEMLKKEKVYIQKMLAIKGLENKEIADLQIQEIENSDKIKDADRLKNLAELEKEHREKVAEIEKWYQGELAAGHGDEALYEQLLDTEEIFYLNGQIMFAKNEEEKLKIQEDSVKKQTELLKKIEKERIDSNNKTASNVKQIKNEYRKDLNDELKYLKEFGKLFEDTVLGNAILLKRQLKVNEEVYQQDLAALEERYTSFIDTEQQFKEKTAALDVEKAKKDEQLKEEAQIRDVRRALEIGNEMAKNIGDRYAERLKQEQELQEQLRNGEITQLEYQKKISELKKKNQKGFLKDMLVMLIESLQAAANAEIAKAGVIMMAQAYAVSSLNPAAPFIALGKIALMAAAVNGIAALAKAKLQATQFATGKYPVTGADDGRTYNASYIGKPKTGLYNGPKMALFNENPRMPELVVDGLTTRKLMFNYPDIYSSILALSGKRPMKQFAEGQYPQTGLPTDSNRANSDAQMVATMELVAMELSRLRANGVNAKVDIYQIDESLTEIYRRREVANG